jgi:hypothetical protein
MPNPDSKSYIVNDQPTLSEGLMEARSILSALDPKGPADL